MQCTNSQAGYYARDVEKQQRRQKTCKETWPNPSTGPHLRLQDTKTTWDGDRGTKGVKTPNAGYQSYVQHLSGAGCFGATAVLIHGWVYPPVLFPGGFSVVRLFFRASRLCPSAPSAPARPRHTNRPSRRPAGAAPASAPLTSVAFRCQVVSHVATQRPRRRRLRAG